MQSSSVTEGFCSRSSSRFRLALVCLVVLAASASAAAPAEEGRVVAWTELASHLGSKISSATQLDVVACPESRVELEPQRRGLQWIEGTFYRWDEFDLSSGGTCLRMVDPLPKFLSQFEAQVLLSGSGLWEEQAAAFASREGVDGPLGQFGLDGNLIPWRPPAPSTSAAPTAELSKVGYPVDDSDPRSRERPESENDRSEETPAGTTDEADGLVEVTSGTAIGADERQRVGNTSAVPYRHIALIENKGRRSSGRATGFLISPHALLTNGHVVWDRAFATFKTDNNFAPGFYLNAGAPQTPFGQRRASRLAVSSGYVQTRQTQYDYGAMFFDNRFQGINTTMPIFLNVSPTHGTPVEVAGYPGAVRGQGTFQPHTHTDAVLAVQGRVLRYRTDTSGGNSGSPVMIERNGQKRAIAVHSSGDAPPAVANSGARFVSANEELLVEWMRWEPRDRAGLDLTILTPEISGCPKIELLVQVEDDQGDPVPDLNASFFRLFENGNERDITVLPGDFAESERNIALLLDGSSSLSSSDIDAQKQAAKSFVSRLSPTDRLAIYVFDSTVTRLLGFSTNRSAAIAAIDTLSANGSTALFSAIVEAAVDLDGQAGRRAIVLMTDGASNAGGFSLRDAIDAADAAGAPVFAAGFGSARDSVLTQIANETGGAYFRSPSAADLEQILRLINTQINNFYVISWLTEFADPTDLAIEVIVRDGDDSDRETTRFRLRDTPCRRVNSQCTVDVLSPNGGETWIKGRSQTIEWTTSGSGCGSQVSLALFDGTDLHYLPDTADDGVEQIDIRSFPDSSLYRAVVTDLRSANVGKSDANFTIDLPFQPFPCPGNNQTLCLNNDRFMVQATHRVAGETRRATAVPLTADTGYFWFFDSANVELVTKVIDGRALNGFYWLFYGALSDVEYALYVTDTQTGISKAYFNPKGVQASRADTSYFSPVRPEGPDLVLADSGSSAGVIPELTASADLFTSTHLDRGAFGSNGATPPAGPGGTTADIEHPTLRPSTENQSTVLYSQLDFLNERGVTSQNFLDLDNRFHSQAADDFTVPSGLSWRVDRVDVRGGYEAANDSAVGPAASVNVRIYRDGFNIPTTVLCEYRRLRPVGGAGSPNFRINLPQPCVVPSGRHWVEVQVNQAIGTNGQWFWRTRTRTSGVPANFRNVGGFFGCTEWNLLPFCIDGLGLWDLAFSVTGTVGGGSGGRCVANATTLCLGGGRFRVTVDWTTPSGSGDGIATRLTPDTGYFWFFESSNVELVLKVLDARAINNHFWIFYGALSDTEYEITVEDTVTGESKTYENTRGQIASVGDTEGLPGN